MQWLCNGILLCLVAAQLALSPARGCEMNGIKGAARAFVMKSLGLSQLVKAFTTGRDVDSSPVIFHESYRQSAWVMAAINHVTQPIKSVPLKFYQRDTEITAGPVVEFWRAPAQSMSREGWIDASAGWFKLRGETFWLLDDSWLSRSPRKSRFIVARPDDMREIVRGGELIGWVWTDAGGRQIPLIPEQVIHLKRWNPYNTWRGLGELEAARIAAEADFFAGRFARDTFRNAGDQGVYVVAKGGHPTDAQQAQMIAALRDKQFARRRGDYQPIFLSGDVDIKDPTVATPDAAFAGNRISSRHEIFAAFGVPVSMADVQASYSIGSASDYFRLFMGTCQPLGRTICGAINDLVARMDSRAGLESEFDWDEHPTMQAIRAERITSAKELWAMGMPMQQINDYLDMGLTPFPGWEKGYLPFSVAEVGADALPAPAPAQAPASGDAVQQMISALKCGCATPQATRAGDRQSLWEKHMRARRATERAYQSKWGRAINDARRETLAKLEAATGKTKSVAADLTFDLEEWKTGFQASMRKVGLSAIQEAVAGLLSEIQLADDVWSMPPAKAIEFLGSRANFLSDIADDVHARIEGAIQQGLSEGNSIKDIAAKVREEFNSISRERATVIAQTETAAAYGYARDEAMRGTGVQYKQWLTSGNENVRPTHMAAERQTVPVDEPFMVGGYPLNFPGDGSLGAPPEELINCRCVQIAVLQKPDSAA